MDALQNGEPLAEEVPARQGVADLSFRRLTDVELDERIRTGWNVWCDLLDELLSTGGLLPSAQLVARTAAFFEGEYWRAEDARIEALRRQMTSRMIDNARARDHVRGLR